ncbi:MAG TPA: sulfite exporter TauE/SafE family protein [Pseudolabrys sp.]|nr:sulfite exporter TauE/SafE family protein [Pseudolabrys sp.]
MDGWHLALFLAATYFGGLTSGLSGFAMGLVVSGVWLHVMSPEQSATLIVLSGLVTQGSGIWRVRHAINWRTVSPFIIGGALGIPAGTALLRSVDPDTIRLGIGVLLLIYSLYSLIRPAFEPVKANFPADFGVGIANGLISGLTGLGGVAVTVWCQLRGGQKDALRAIFQPVLFATFVMTTISFAVAGAVTVDTLKLYALALPVLIAGIWSGFGLYGKLDDAAFRKVILVLLLASGVALIVPMH